MNPVGTKEHSFDPQQTQTSIYALHELRVGERIAGRFRIESILGVGGMGVVFKAFDEELDVEVALKLLRPEIAVRADAFERFRQELLMARQISSPHVVRIHDLVRHEQHWLISMDYVSGGSLEGWLGSHGRMPIDRALSITRNVALGLAAAHAKGVIHRDLKPANILLTESLDATITDFGVARSAGVAGMTGTGMIVGTPDYLSPEQARGDAVDPRSDLYALGLILFEMLTGRLPFDSGTAAEALAQRIVRAPKPVRSYRKDVPVWVERLVARLLETRPNRRFSSAQDVVAALDRKFLPPALPPARRLAAVAAVVVVLAVAGFGYRQWHTLVTEQARREAALTVELVPLPVASDPQDSSLAHALGAQISEALIDTDHSVADRVRVATRLRYLGFDRADPAEHVDELRESFGAASVLAARLTRSGDGFEVTFDLIGADASGPTRRTERTGAVAFEALAPALAQALGRLGLSVNDLELPRSLAASEAYGGALRRDPETAPLALLDAAIAADPRFAAAWTQRLKLARSALSGVALDALLAESRQGVRDLRGGDAELSRSLIAMMEGRPMDAVERLRALVARHPDDHSARLIYAEALNAAGDSHGALRELETITLADPYNADAWRQLGIVALGMGRAQPAIDEHLLRASVLYTRLGDQRGLADTANAMGVAYERLGQPEPAIESLKRAEALYRALPHPRGVAKAKRNLAWIHATGGDQQLALAELRSAREILQGIDDPEAMAGLLQDEGMIAEEFGDYPAALAAYLDALSLQTALDKKLAVAVLSQHIGHAYLQIGNFQSAKAYLDQALSTSVALDNPAVSIAARLSLALVDMASGDYEVADRRLREALHESQARNFVEAIAVANTELGEIARLLGKPERAFALWDTAGQFFRERGDLRGQVEIASRRAALLADLRRWDEMAKVVAEWVRFSPDTPEQQALLALRQSALQWGTGDHARALTSADAALSLAIQAHSRPIEIEAMLWRARALVALERRTEASEALDRSRAMLADYPQHFLSQFGVVVGTESLVGAEAAAVYRAATETDGRTMPTLLAVALHEAGASALRAAGREADARLADRQARDLLVAVDAASSADLATSDE